MKRNKLILGTLALYLSLACCQSKKQEHAKIWAMLPFEKIEDNPILEAGTGRFVCPILEISVAWEEKDVFNPAAVVRNDSVFLLYRAEDTIGKHAGTSRIGLAVSADGIHFERRPTPVLFPDNDAMKAYEWEGGIEDPRVVQNDSGTYILTYTAYDGTTARLCIASSNDLINWKKHGLAFDDRYLQLWSKSGAIVATQEGSNAIATRINGKYWMYFGDTDLFIATSDDLINWVPIEENGKLKSVLKPRPEYFDSRLVESGPFALASDKGILLLYNGMNLDEGGDTSLAKGAYCAGQALFSANDPSKVIDRVESNFLKPDKPFEISGQVNQVCFIEGMVFFRNQYFLYYGTADSKIAVAIHQP